MWKPFGVESLCGVPLGCHPHHCPLDHGFAHSTALTGEEFPETRQRCANCPSVARARRSANLDGLNGADMSPNPADERR